MRLLIVQDIAWVHSQIGEIETDRQNLEAGAHEYAAARMLMERLGQRVYRRDEWLDRFARVYNGSALLVNERVSYLLRDRDLKGTLAPEQQKEVNESLVLA